MAALRIASLVLVLGACGTTDAGPHAPSSAPTTPATSVPINTSTAVPTGTSTKATSKTLPAVTPPPNCIDDSKPFDHTTLHDRIAFLASADLGGRVPGSAGDTAARALIRDRFACLGLAPAGDNHTFEQAFTDANHRATANVVGFIAGTDDVVGSEIIVIGAHHDHIGGKLLGANDNASGVVALLAIAQAIKQRETGPRRTIAFVTFGAEEQGMIGSEYFAAHPPTALPLGKVVQYINLDMIGSHASKGFVAAMGTFAKQPARKLLDTQVTKFPKLHVGLGGRAARSDHSPFCRAGIPYVFLWTPDARCYHQACDTADKIDVPRMADIAALAGDLAWELAESEIDLAGSRAKLGCGQES